MVFGICRKIFLTCGAVDMFDRVDLQILAILQEDCTIPVAEIGKQVGLSTTPCWRRIQKLEADGVIEGRVALLDPQKSQCGGDGVCLYLHQPAHTRMA